MIHLLAEVQIQDLPQFIGVFSTRGAALRHEHGSRGSRVFRVAESPDRAVVVFPWESRAAFDGFLADPLCANP